MSLESQPPNAQDASLQAFLARHVTSYDPDTDDYERPPFAADIKEGKNDPIYNAHSYHTKVPPRSIIPYILHYTQPGDLVLDLFCGSGMTGVAAQMCANPPADILEQFPELKDRVGPRACVLNDLSPAACHIAYNYNTPVDVAALKREFERIKAAVKDEFGWLYGTEHYEPAVGLYDLANVEGATVQGAGVGGGEPLGLAMHVRRIAGGPLPVTGGDVTGERGKGGGEFGGADFPPEQPAAERGAQFQFLPDGQGQRGRCGADQGFGVRAVGLGGVELDEQAGVHVGRAHRPPRSWFGRGWEPGRTRAP